MYLLRVRYTYSTPNAMIVLTRHIQQQLLKSRYVSENHFSTCSFLQAARRSPRVKNLEWQRKQKTKLNPHPSTPTQQPTSAAIQWPLAILQDAEKTGALPVSLRAAIAILDDFNSMRTKSGKQLCSSMLGTNVSICNY